MCKLCSGLSKVPSVNDWVVNGERGESARVKITLPTDFNRLLVSTTIDRVLELTQLGATLRARCECSTDRLYVCWGRGHNTMEGVGTRSQSESKNHIPTVFNRLLVRTTINRALERTAFRRAGLL